MRRPTVAEAGSAVVALIAGYASFRHIVHVATNYGEPFPVAVVLPVCIDALMLVAVAAMSEDKRNGRKPRGSARSAFAFGVAASLAANIASAHPTAGARIVAAVPAVALLLAVEVLSRKGKPADATVTPAPAPQPASAPTPPVPTVKPAPVVKAPRPRSTRKAPNAVKVERAAARTPDATVAEIAAKAGVSESTARRYLPARPAAELPSVNGSQPAEMAGV